MATILAIESSCDDTSAAIIKDAIILSNGVATQKLHEKYGGVVPEIASRQHQINILPVVQNALDEANVNKSELDAIAVTRGPGLMGSLLVGLSFAKAMALSLNIPIIEVNHMQAHVLAHFIDPPQPKFPFLCLTVSGGHTQIVLIQDPLSMKVLGNTKDDAAGELFDKSGKMLGLDYPAGPIIDKLAREGEAIFKFPEGKVKDLDFSFSGVKTAIRYFLRDNVNENPNFIAENLNDICASIQANIVQTLIKKLKIAAKQLDIKEISIAGGVSANSGLRKALEETGAELGWNTYIPKISYCTDNAAMIAMAAHYKYEAGLFADQRIRPEARYAF
jgi:N6-L-threonylcarbamoyladenine synthase